MCPLTSCDADADASSGVSCPELFAGPGLAGWPSSAAPGGRSWAHWLVLYY